MEFQIIAPGADNIEIVNSVPSSYTGPVIPMALPTIARAYFGDLLFQHYAGNGFDIWFSNYFIQKDTVLIGRGDLPILELRIHLMNAAQTGWNGSSLNTIMPYQYNLSYTPFMDNKSKFEANKRCQTFDIHFKIPYLERLAPDFPVLSKFLEKVIKGQPTELSELDRYLSPGMIQLVNILMNCPYKNGSAALFIEAKVIELLLVVLEECCDEAPLKAIRLSNYDIEMLQAMKQHTEKEFVNPLTIKELARKFTINEYKLKKGFKFLFGTSVYNYMNRMRMEKAALTLLETDLQVEEIASLTGFEDRAAFDKAFKKHFSCTPVYYRKHG